MTKPTQAQIEAAAVAICKSKTCEGINCCQWPANGGKRRDNFGQPIPCNVKLGAYDDAAKAALTAAAEVGEKHGPLDNTRHLTPVEQDMMQRALRASSVKIEQLDPELTFPPKKRTVIHPQATINATIERCAQVAEDLLGPNPEWDVAARIRALKDRL